MPIKRKNNLNLLNNLEHSIPSAVIAKVTIISEKLHFYKGFRKMNLQIQMNFIFLAPISLTTNLLVMSATSIRELLNRGSFHHFLRGYFSINLRERWLINAKNLHQKMEILLSWKLLKNSISMEENLSNDWKQFQLMLT